MVRKKEEKFNLLRPFNVGMGLWPGSEHPFNEESPSLAYSAESVSQRENPSGFLDEKFKHSKPDGPDLPLS